MKIFITGSSGMLADEIIQECKGMGYELVLTDINSSVPEIIAMDISDKGSIIGKIEEEKPDLVMHLAAETNVDLCEKEPAHAYAVNVDGTENVALACRKVGAKMIFISSANVFNGEKEEPYIETDQPVPVNVYGRTKLKAETLVKDLVPEHYIFRAGWMMGGWEIDKKFVYKIVKQIKEGKKELMAVDDKFGSPTFTKDFADNLMKVIDVAKPGIYHMANTGTGSRYDIACKIVEFMGSGAKVMPVSSDKFPLPAPRIRSEMLSNYRLEMLGLNNMPHWEESLRCYIQDNTQVKR